jgi:hypothetical protein
MTSDGHKKHTAVPNPNLDRADDDRMLDAVTVDELDSVTGWLVGDSLTLSAADADALCGGLLDRSDGDSDVSSGSKQCNNSMQQRLVNRDLRPVHYYNYGTVSVP